MRQKPPISAGAVRWLHVDADGREQWFAREPRNVAKSPRRDDQDRRRRDHRENLDAAQGGPPARRRLDHEGPADGASDTWIRKRR